MPGESPSDNSATSSLFCLPPCLLRGMRLDSRTYKRPSSLLLQYFSSCKLNLYHIFGATRVVRQRTDKHAWNRTICYATIRPSWSSAQLGFNVLAGIGQAGPLTLLVACIQFTAPHAFLSTATGLAFSARAIGGAFGSAVLNAIINGQLASHYAAGVESAAVNAGLATGSVPALLEALAAGQIGLGVDTATPAVWAAAVEASRWQYAHAYRLAWASVIPFVVLAIVAVALLKGVKDLMTEEVEATVEHV